jgi:hypothetical protein
LSDERRKFPEGEVARRVMCCGFEREQEAVRIFPAKTALTPP